MLLSKNTQHIQEAVAKYCISGEIIELPNTSIERLSNYKRLVNNILIDTIESAYPITVANIEDEIWDVWVQQFIQNHNCQTPIIWQLPFEFYQFVVENYFQEQYQLPILNELLYFEWLEIEMFMMEDAPLDNFKTDGNIEYDNIYLNPESQIIQLNYPLHKFIPKEAIELKGNYFVLIFRELTEKILQFVQVSPIHVWLIEYLQQHNSSLSNAINQFSIEHNFEINDVQKQQLILFFEHLKSKEFVLGFK